MISPTTMPQNMAQNMPPAERLQFYAVACSGAVSSRFFDQMALRGIPYDVIGLSYYPKWHNTLADLEYNLDDLSRRYNKDVIVVEYSHVKKEVNKLAFTVAGGRGKGSCIWEPLNTWEQFFDKDGKANELLLLYDEISKEFLE